MASNIVNTPICNTTMHCKSLHSLILKYGMGETDHIIRYPCDTMNKDFFCKVATPLLNKLVNLVWDSLHSVDLEFLC